MNSLTEKKTNAYPLMEHFYSVQGEGYHQGRAAYFVRLGGCDVGCVWCDVKDSWDAENHPDTACSDIVSFIEEAKAKFVVVTGGEPLMYDCETLCSSLHQNKLELALETSGAYPITGEWDWICVSPKKFKAPLAETLAKANELKVIVFNKSDFAWAEEHAQLVSPNCKLYLQPEWSKKGEMSPLLIDYIQQNPQWSLSLQTHKYLNVR
jgi:organic radical activating enzyme